MTETEKKHRLAAVQNAIGTHRAEGITVDSEIERMMNLFVEGQLSLDELSAAMRACADRTMAQPRVMAGAA